MPPTPPELIKLIVNDYLANKTSLKNLSIKFKRTTGTILKILITSNIGYKHKSKYDGRILDFIKANYLEKGAKYCADNLGMSIRMVKQVATTYGVKRIIVPSFAFSCENLIIDTPEFAYILGLLWADGYLNIKENRTYRICIESVSDDLIGLIPIFEKVGIWHKRERNRVNRRPQLSLRATSREFALWLQDHDYTAKSYKSADKILSKIPENLRHYWFRGLIDGDGHIGVQYYKKDSIATGRLSISSGIEQDWSYVEKLFDNLNISYSIKRSTRFNKLSQKNNSYSYIETYRQRDIVKFCEYIYQNYENDQIGLKRKYDKFIFIKGECDKRDWGNLKNGR